MTDRNVTEPVAIIGMSGRFPAARDVDQLWRNIRDGVESITRFKREELIAAGVPVDIVDRDDHIPAGAMLEDIDLFDANFFGYSPREAELIDPQQRLFLECAWEALESAGYRSETADEPIGVFAGGHNSTYLTNNLLGHPELTDGADSLRLILGNHVDYLATRASYKLDLTGPSFTVATACSTSLVAVVLAVQSLIDRRCGMALAGGVTVRVPEAMGYFHKEGDLFSADGHCRPFDSEASGTVFGNGVGVVILKRLADAQRDHDHILGVILGASINNDGADKVGFVAPSIDGQCEVIREALEQAGIDRTTIGYVEAHGTATTLGDPIEVAGLAKAYGYQDGIGHRCVIGSVKETVGHLNAAAGVTGLIKTVQMLRYKQLPPSIHFKTPNPSIDWDGNPFYVNTELQDWVSAKGPRRAGVSSFGVGGTNAHLIVEEAPPRQVKADDGTLQLLPISAQSATALQHIAEELANHLETNPEIALADAAFTLQEGRRSFAYRRAFVSGARHELLDSLNALGPDTRRASTHRRRPVALMFPGQGSQYPGMARSLYEAAPRYRSEMDLCFEILGPHLEIDLRSLIHGGPEGAEVLAETRISQPAIFTVSYALARYWMHLGITPDVLLGHSVGEFVAACIGGVFKLEDALRLICERGRLMQTTPRGAMLAVMAGREFIIPALTDTLDLAAVNSPDSCVVSGSPDDIEGLAASLAVDGVGFARLDTSHAFHSAMMDAVVDPFADAIAKICMSPPQTPIISTLSGKRLSDEQATDPRYWASHLRRTVQFVDALQTLTNLDEDLLIIESGPGQTLSSLARRQLDDRKNIDVITSLARPGKPDLDRAAFLKAVGNVWVAGLEIDWTQIRTGEPPRRARLPTYPFERQRHWVEPSGGFLPAYATRNVAARPTSLKNVYSIAWRKSPLKTQSSNELLQGRTWAVFMKKGGIGKRVAKELTRLGCDIVGLREAEAFARRGKDCFDLPPGDEAAIAKLFSTLASEGRAPTRFVHLWNLGDLTETKPTSESASATLARGLFTLFHSVKMLGVRADDVRWLIAVNGAISVNGESLAYPDKATIFGMCRVAPQEYSNMAFRVIDFAIGEASDADILAKNITDEALALNSGPRPPAASPGALVARRADARWVPSICRLEVPDPVKLKERVRDGGVYLITGGLGALGSTLARWLVRQAHVKLVLIQSSGLPARSDWDAWQADHGVDDPVSQRIATVLNLEAQGAEVMVEVADVANGEQMSAVVKQATEQFGCIRGVVHAAGIADGRLIQQRSADTLNQVLQPKLGGALVLERLFPEPLDFFVMCSSIAALLPPPGQAGYCSANAFLDAFAAHRAAALGEFAVSINWDAWSGAGMAMESRAGFTENGDVFAKISAGNTISGHPLLGNLEPTSGANFVYRAQLRSDALWVLGDHLILSTPILPGVAVLEILYAAGKQQLDTPVVEITNLFLLEPFAVPWNAELSVKTVITPNEHGFEAVIMSRLYPFGKVWRENVRATIAGHPACVPAPLDLHALRERLLAVDHEKILAESHANRGALEFGARWNNISDLRCTSTESYVELQLADAHKKDVKTYALHPAVMDNACAMLSLYIERTEAMLPFYYKRVHIHDRVPDHAFAHARLAEKGRSGETMAFDLTIASPEGKVLVEIEGYTLKRVPETALAKARATAAATGPRTVRALTTVPGRVDSLQFDSIPRRQPGTGEIEIKTTAVAMNYKDVLFATGRMPHPGGANAGYCLECAGKVVAIGPGASNFEIGDEVLALSLECLAGHVTVAQDLCRPKPPGLSFEQAAALPVAYLTAYYALIEKARLVAGETVLIHAGSGGVGLAAINIARRFNAEIFATAGSPEKRAFLLEQGVKHVMDSRSLAFVDEVLEQTNGRGVDVILNSLAGEFLLSSLSILAPFGRFIEIGVRDILEDTKIGLRIFANSGSFIPIILSPTVPRFHETLDAVMQLVNDNEVQALPVTTYRFSQVREAFAFMAAAKHTGKLVLRNEDEELRTLNSGALKDAGTYSTASKHETRGESIKKPGPMAISPDEGAAFFGQIMGQATSQAIVTKRPIFGDAGDAHTHRAKFGHRDASPLRENHPRPDLPIPYVPPRSTVEKQLAEIWCEVLGIDPIGINDNFIDLGGDSLIATRVISRVKAEFVCDLPISSVFEFATIAELATFMERKHDQASSDHDDLDGGDQA